MAITVTSWPGLGSTGRHGTATATAHSGILQFSHHCRWELWMNPLLLPGLVNIYKKRWKITIVNGKTMGKPWENGDLYGTSPCYQWVNPLFLWTIFKFAKCNSHYQRETWTISDIASDPPRKIWEFIWVSFSSGFPLGKSSIYIYCDFS